MDFSFGAGDEELRARARAWLTGHLVGPYADARGLGGPGSEHEGVAARRDWERELGRGGWIGQGWEVPDGAYGQRRLSSPARWCGRRSTRRCARPAASATSARTSSRPP